MKNINLVRKIAWSFHQTTNIDIDELIAEASLAYCEAFNSYQPQRGRLCTYIWICINNHLKNQINKYGKYHYPLLSTEDLIINKTVESHFLWEYLSEDAQKLTNILLSKSDYFVKLNPPKAQKKLIQIMSRKGWSPCRIIAGIENIKNALQ
jgi:DNA-directed RNA polymerase sigma subunit (sigma70/sigma32)